MLGDEALDHHVRRLRAERVGIVLPTHGHDQVDPVGERVDQEPEEVEIVVPDRPHRDVDEGPFARAEPVRPVVGQGRAGRRPHRLHALQPVDLGALQARRARIDVQVVEEAGPRMGVETSGAPVRSGTGAGGSEHRVGDQRTEPDVDVGDARLGAHQRRGELGHLVQHEVRLPAVQHRLEVPGPRLQFEVGEDLGEEEGSLVVADQFPESREPRCPFGTEGVGRTRLERRETCLAGSTHHRIARGEGDVVARGSRRLCQREERIEVAGQRAAGEQESGHAIPLWTRPPTPWCARVRSRGRVRPATGRSASFLVVLLVGPTPGTDRSSQAAGMALHLDPGLRPIRRLGICRGRRHRLGLGRGLARRSRGRSRGVGCGCGLGCGLPRPRPWPRARRGG